jgi:mono/diheme cytochrome c family protein
MSALKPLALALCLITAAACASSSGEQASTQPGSVPTVNPSFALDANKAEAGWDVWRDKACHVCHSIGKGRNAGPDLFGLVERRQLDWIKNFLLHTEEMLETDPIAIAMYEQYQKQKMPNMKLTEQQIDNLIHYIQRETNKARSD